MDATAINEAATTERLAAATHADTHAATNAAAAPAPRPGRRAARILGVIAILFAGLFATFGGQSPAHAAGSYATGISFCTTPNVNVSLERWYGGGHTSQVKTGNSGPTGCATFRYVDAGYNYVVTRTVVRGTCTYGATMTVYISQNWTTAVANQTRGVGSLGHWYSQRIC